MNPNLRVFTWIMQSRSLLILLLSVASGWTTWKGLKLFIDAPIALVLTAAVQMIVVIATYQLSKMYLRASLRRYIAVAVGLGAAFAVSVFFSYFTFYEYNEGDRVGQRKMAQTRDHIEQYVTQVVNARTKYLTDLGDTVTRLNRQAQDALEGRLPGVRPGVGPIFLSLKKLADDAEKTLSRESTSDDVSRNAAALSGVLSALTASATAPNEPTYNELQQRFIGFQNAAQTWLMTHARGTRIVPPTIPPRKSYETVRPSPTDLSQFSPVAFSLAMLVDLFTVLLTWWLESVPFGGLRPEQVQPAFDALWEFPEWTINRNGHFEFRLTQNDDERYEGYNDANRLFWTGVLLSLGLLRRTERERCEFTPRLYTEFSNLISSNKGGHYGNTSSRATTASSAVSA
jgi:ABC-type multidrug transport system fused ATPase/permease subunit